jgi:lipid-binding SYLF domain-containing protein
MQHVSSVLWAAIAVSYGLQAGVQAFGFALVLITQAALDYLKRSAGWEIGTGPALVVADKGSAGSLSTTSARKTNENYRRMQGP